MKKLALHWKIIIGMVLGVIWALLSSSFGWSQFTINWIDPFGTIFINLLKLIAVPLVLFSIISGISSLGSAANIGRMGSKTLLFYFATTIIAITIGLLLVNAIKPGKLIDEQSRIDNRINYELWAVSEGHEIKDGINYLQNPEFFERAQKISQLSKSQIEDAAVAERIKTAHKFQEKSPL